MKKWATVLAVVAVMSWAFSASATILLYEDFEGPAPGWLTFGEAFGQDISLWHKEDHRSVSGSYSAAYNTGAPNYRVPFTPNYGFLISPAMDLSAYTDIRLDFYSWVDAGPLMLALGLVGVGDDFVSPWLPVNWVTPHEQWNHLYADLSPLAGLSDVRIGFFFATAGGPGGGMRPPCSAEGWYIDDVRVRGLGEPVPEPSTWLLLMGGLGGLGLVTRRRRRM